MSDAPPPPIGGNHLPPRPSDGIVPQLAGSGGYDLGEAFGWAWRSFTNHAGFVVVGALVVGVVEIVLAVATWGIDRAVFGDDDGFENRADGSFVVDPATFVGSLGLQSVTGLVLGLVSSVLYVNYHRGLLDIAAGRWPTVRQLFRLDRAGTSMLTGLVVGLVATIGYALLILPGLLWQVFSIFALFFVAAGSTSAFDAIGSSLRLVRDNVGQVLLLAVVCLMLAVVGTCACGVGLLVAMPIVLLLITYAFCVMQHRTVAG